MENLYTFLKSALDVDLISVIAHFLPDDSYIHTSVDFALKLVLL